MSVTASDESVESPPGVELQPNERVLYGAIWGPWQSAGGKLVPRPNWVIEKECLVSSRKPRGYRGRAFHLRQFISEIWGRKNDLFWLQWNPNAVEIINRYCEHKVTAIAGCASSGKSYAMASIAVAEFLLNPMDVKVLVTSLTKQASVSRIWGDIQNCWQVAEQFFKREGVGVPGRLLLGKYVIRCEIGKVINNKAGVELLAGDEGTEKESSAKVQGVKAGTLIVIGDEFSEMNHSIYNAVISNLRANPNSRLLAALNPNTPFDPGGLCCKPVGGWHKVAVDFDGWPTEIGGWCIHFNGEKSPNILDPRRPWNRILDADMLADIEKSNPKGTKGYDRFVRGWWSSTGARASIYDLADIEMFRADQREMKWVGALTFYAGLDIGNAHGGDKTVLTLGRAGMARSETGEIHVVCERVETLVLSENMALDDSLSEQIVKRVKFEMQQGVWGPDTVLAGIKRSVPTANLAVDCSGGGTHFGALLARDIGAGFIMVNFGDKASDRRVSKNDKRLGHEAFHNRVSELWGAPVQLIRSGQIRGMDPDLIEELTSRTYKDDASKRMQVESKDDMKRRSNGKSPDRSDSWVLFVEAARVRGGLSSSEKAAMVTRSPVDREKLRRQQEELFGGYEVLDARSGGWGD